MIQLSKMIVCAALSLLLGACATAMGTATEPAEAYGVLSKSAGSRAQSVYPVNILQVGDDDTFAEQSNITVKPGDYVLRVAPEDFRDIARNENIRLSGNQYPAFEELVREMPITIEEGKRYFIGARFIGPTLFDWKPVVIRVERLAGF